MRFRELQDKEVINACDCCKLGNVDVSYTHLTLPTILIV